MDRLCGVFLSHNIIFELTLSPKSPFRIYRSHSPHVDPYRWRWFALNQMICAGGVTGNTEAQGVQIVSDYRSLLSPSERRHGDNYVDRRLDQMQMRLCVQWRRSCCSRRRQCWRWCYVRKRFIRLPVVLKKWVRAAVVELVARRSRLDIARRLERGNLISSWRELGTDAMAWFMCFRLCYFGFSVAADL